MKKLFTLFAFFLFLQNHHAQSIPECQFVPTPDYYDLSKYSNRFQAIPDDGRKFVLNVKFHYVLPSNGTNIYNLNEEKMLKYLAIANIHFNPFGIFFKYRGSDYIKDDAAWNSTDTNLIKNKFVQKGYYNANSINFFVTKFVNTELSNTGDLIVSAQRTDLQMLTYEIGHKMGHTLGLLHVDTGHDGSAITNFLPTCITAVAITNNKKMTKPSFIPNLDIYENVTRDPLNPKFNADIKGDLVVDTEACWAGTQRSFKDNYCRNPQPGDLIYGPDYLSYNEDPRVTDNSGDANTSAYYCGATSTRYNYTNGNNYYTTVTNGVTTTVPLGTSTWQNIINTMLANCTAIFPGETYKISEDLVNNFMISIGNYPPGQFTPGQGQRMREKLLGNLTGSNTLSQKLNLLDDGSPDLSVLYEPFAFGSTGNTNPPSGTAYAKTMTPNETNTGVNVWNCGPFVARFQTGFDCEFSNPSGQVITQTPYQQYNATCSGYIGVKIPILGQDIIQTMEPMCFSSFEPYIKGEIKSLDYIGSFYFTIEELDAIKASNPDLYNELQSGKYHIIIKETESGYIDQKLIYKN